MRTSNLNSIVAALVDGPRPIPEIAQITGLSYSTVQRGLVQLGAARQVGTYPFEWKLSGAEGHLPESAGEFIDKLVSKWNEGRNRIGSGIASIKIEPQSDPKALAESFEQGAATMANAAYTLRQVATKPDWFVLVGGNLEDHQVN